MGIVGPGKRVGAVTQLLDICAPLFNRFISQCFLRVGLCSHTFFCCRTRGGPAGVGFDQDGGDRMDPSPHDLNYNTCAKSDLSEVTYLSFGDAWRHNERPIFIGRMTRDSSRMYDREDLHQRISSNDRDSMSCWRTVETRGHFDDEGSSSIERLAVDSHRDRDLTT